MLTQTDTQSGTQQGTQQGGTQGSGMRVTVEPAVDLMARLGTPEKKFRTVHIAGTKGKGSVAALVSGALEAAGIRSGVFASPHVERINERVRIAGLLIEDAELAHVLHRALEARTHALAEGTAGADSSWFDVLTAAAMLAFARAEVEWAVVECGLGGRLDSTNALCGEVCVITSIDLEHTDVLGGTLELIAFEKAGILDTGATLVTAVASASAAGSVIDARAHELGVEVVRPAVAERTIAGENAALAGCVISELGRRGVRDRGGELLCGPIEERVRQEARLPGRLEICRYEGIRVILDGAHVPSSLDRVLRDLDGMEVLSGSPLIAILGVGRDKDIEGLLKLLVGRADRVLCTSVGEGPVRSPDEIQEVAERLRLAAETAAEPRVAFERALELANPHGVVLVTGSLHLIGILRPILSPHDPC